MVTTVGSIRQPALSEVEGYDRDDWIAVFFFSLCLRRFRAADPPPRPLRKPLRRASPLHLLHPLHLSHLTPLSRPTPLRAGVATRHGEQARATCRPRCT